MIERNRFKILESRGLETNVLRKIESNELENFIKDNAIALSWEEAHSITSTFKLPEMSGGVNIGDQRAIFYMIAHFQPKRLLEIGTHIGCSTIHIALALKLSNNSNTHLITVDIEDVNDSMEKRWKKFGSKYSPRELVENVHYDERATFVKDNSLHFLSNCKERFDFIFLDGSHYAPIVYQEIPLALKLLNNNGTILLHDYFPNGKPLWGKSPVVTGVHLAVKRLVAENSELNVLPIGKLPWFTKLDSKVTSLALLTRR